MKILHLEDNTYDSELIRQVLHRAGLICEITVVQTRAEFVECMEQIGWDLILADYRLPDFDGILALKMAAEKQPGVPFIIATGTLSEDAAVETLKLGASDYVTKNALVRLAPAVLRARREADLMYAHKQASHHLARIEEAYHQEQIQARESEARYRSLINSINEYSILRLDLAGRIVSWTPAAERIKGYTAEEILGKHFSCFYTPEDIAIGKPHNALRFAESHGSLNDEGLRIRKDGSRFWASVSITAIRDEAGQLRGFSKVTRDMTERKRIDDELIATTLRANEASQAKSDFLAAVSHEIRTPMNAILGMAEVLSESKLDAEQRMCVEIFRHSGSGLMELINDILDLAKIEAGKMDFEQTDFQICELVNQTIELISPRMKAKGIGLRVKMAAELLPWVSGDPGRLRQILINLLGNAVKFTTSGEVTLTVQPSESVDSSVEFSVADTGIGIPADQLESIFEDFKQGDTSITRKYGGTGLGLAISRRLVEQLGGRLVVTSELGMGSTFTFTLPFQPAVRAAEVAVSRSNSKPGASESIQPAPAMRTRQRPRILIAEDCSDNQQVLQLFLQDQACTLTFVKNGQEALDVVNASEFDVVLMDLQMPVMDGLTATRKIREIERQQNRPSIPILALSGNVRPEDIKMSQDAGCNAHLAKPISKRFLVEALERYTRARLPEPDDDVLARELAAMAPRYLGNQRKAARELPRLLLQSDFRAIRKFAHDLKGTGTPYGFPGLSTLGQAIQTSADAADTEALGVQLQQLETFLKYAESEQPVIH